MNYKKLLKTELLEIVERLEREKKEVLSGWLLFKNQHRDILSNNALFIEKLKTELESLKGNLMDLQKDKDCLMIAVDVYSGKLHSLDTLFSMVTHSLLNLQADSHEHPLSVLQENIITEADFMRKLVIDKGS